MDEVHRVLRFRTFVSVQLMAQPRRKDLSVEHPTSCRTIKIDGLKIFHREAGPKMTRRLSLRRVIDSNTQQQLKIDWRTYGNDESSGSTKGGTNEGGTDLRARSRFRNNRARDS